MGALVGGLVVFGVLALLVINAVDQERDAEDVGAILTVGVWFAYLVHADTVVTAAFIDVARVPVPKAPMLVAGAIVILAGAILFFWATRTLATKGGFSGLVSRELVTHGPYAWMRHPQDTGWAVVLLGIAIAGRSILAVALVGLFAAFVSRLWRADEQQLTKRFGAAFESYRSRIPPVGRPSAARPSQVERAAADG